MRVSDGVDGEVLEKVGADSCTIYVVIAWNFDLK